MKKLLGVLISLYLVYFAVEYVLFWFGKGHDVTYTIASKDRNYEIKETLVTNRKNNDDFYSFNINDRFIFRIYDTLKRGQKIIKDIKYYQDEKKECMYPIFRNEDYPMDVLCIQNNQMIHYHDIKGIDANLDKFVQTLPNYESKNFEDNVSSHEDIGLVTIYNNNFKDNLHIALTNYKGLYHLSKTKSKEIKLFTNDVYNNSIHALVGKYFVTANYNLEHEFSSFLAVNLNNNNEIEINYNGSLSFDSYVQGIVGDSMYVFDSKNERQYKITPKNRKVEMTSEDGEIKYYNGTIFEIIDIDEIGSSKLLFVQNQTKNGTELVSKEEISGYKYNLSSVNNKIEVTRTSLTGEGKTYLFSANEVRNVCFYKDIIFFIDGNTIKMYSDKTGVRTLASMNELTFNKNIDYDIYIK